ncbi:sugar nucleotide-binding protein [Nonomuraea sp. FMUSA5-5]|uniref:Sugar nucleotide-binding protein n=1 Tax=Nonomuraea composti TaxID=2720023 RepID=A0ABX1B227_9ACTN|nr:sugar nucleotide-binding protein [Nonomuraea sp. FMUSA5-5]
MRVLIVGGSGFLGGELVRRCAADGHEVGATYLTRPGSAPAAWLRLDVRDRPAVTAALDAFRPDVTINAAYRQSSWAVTADGAAHVAAGVARAGGRLVHVSSDAIFSGASTSASSGIPPGTSSGASSETSSGASSGAGWSYDETCPPDPVTPYGAAKAAAETAVRALLPAAAIARTSLIVGHGRSVHETRVRSLAAGTREGVLFTDDVRCPVHVTDLAAALLEVAGRGLTGVLHVAGADAVSRHELGVLIARRDGLDPSRLRTGRRADSGVPGPLEVRLDCTATQRRLSTRLRGAHEFLAPSAVPHDAT